MKRTAAALALWMLLLLSPLSSLAEGRFGFSVEYVHAVMGDSIDLPSLWRGDWPEDALCSVSDESLLYMENETTLLVLGSGLSSLRVTTPDGQEDILWVQAVSNLPGRRALLLAEQIYEDGRVRTGAVNSLQGMADALTGLQFRSGSRFQVTALVDNTREEIEAAVAEAFAEAQEDDTSLIYLSCHGEMVNGEACLTLHDGSSLSVRELERMLRPVPGYKIVLLDFCGSGAFIGQTANALMTENAAHTFRNTPLLESRYLVLASCCADEDSYRMSDTGEVNESSMCTVFARSVCEALGWDPIRDRSVSLRADSNQDGVVTFTELQAYVRRRVGYRLFGTGAIQTIAAMPEVQEAALFARQTLE